MGYLWVDVVQYQNFLRDNILFLSYVALKIVYHPYKRSVIEWVFKSSKTNWIDPTVSFNLAIYKIESKIVSYVLSGHQPWPIKNALTIIPFYFPKKILKFELFE